MPRVALRQGASSEYWAERSATRGEIRLRSHFEGLRYGGFYAMVVDGGRIDALYSRGLWGGNAPSMTGRMETRVLRACLVSPVYGGDQKPTAEGRKMELRRTSLLRSASAKHLLSESLAVPGCDKCRHVSPSVTPPRRGSRNNAARRLVRVGAGLHCPVAARLSRTSRVTNETRHPR